MPFFRPLSRQTLATALLTSLFAMTAPAAMAQDQGDQGEHGHAHHHDHAAAADTPAKTASIDNPAEVMTAGEVTRVDPRAGKLTIRHEEIKNLDMPAMTMVFALQDASQLKDIKPGDKLRFHVEERNGALTITKIKRAQ